nr:MAG TPA: hypothetical protein [Caudoviricetes sp.]
MKPRAPIHTAERLALKCGLCPCCLGGLLRGKTLSRIEIGCKRERTREHTVHHGTPPRRTIVARIRPMKRGLILKVRRLLEHIVNTLPPVIEVHARLLIDCIARICKSRRRATRGGDAARPDGRTLLSYPQECTPPLVFGIDLVVFRLPLCRLLRLVRIHLCDLRILLRLPCCRLCLCLLRPPLHPRGKKRSHYHCRYTHSYSLLFEKLKQMIRKPVQSHRLRLMNDRPEPFEPRDRRVIAFVDVVIEVLPVMQKRADSFARFLARIDFMLRGLRCRKHPDNTVPQERICLDNTKSRNDDTVAVTGIGRFAVTPTTHHLRFDVRPRHADELAAIFGTQMCGKIAKIVIRWRVIGKFSHLLPPPAQWIGSSVGADPSA